MSTLRGTTRGGPLVFARVSTYSGAPDGVDESIREGREQIVPAVRQIPGCKGLLYLVDRSTGKAMSVTLWASEEAANQIRGESVQVDRFEVRSTNRSKATKPLAEGGRGVD